MKSARDLQGFADARTSVYVASKGCYHGPGKITLTEDGNVRSVNDRTGRVSVIAIEAIDQCYNHTRTALHPRV